MTQNVPWNPSAPLGLNSQICGMGQEDRMRKSFNRIAALAAIAALTLLATLAGAARAAGSRVSLNAGALVRDTGDGVTLTARTRTLPPGGRIVIVGASLAGLAAAAALRREGFTGPLTMIGDERHEPYDRPPLSKQALGGWIAPDHTRLPRSHTDFSALSVVRTPVRLFTVIELTMFGSTVSPWRSWNVNRSR